MLSNGSSSHQDSAFISLLFFWRRQKEKLGFIALKGICILLLSTLLVAYTSTVIRISTTLQILPYKCNICNCFINLDSNFDIISSFFFFSILSKHSF